MLQHGVDPEPMALLEVTTATTEMVYTLIQAGWASRCDPSDTVYSYSITPLATVVMCEPGWGYMFTCSAGCRGEAFIKLLVCAGNPIGDWKELRSGQAFCMYTDFGDITTRLLDAVSVPDGQQRRGWLEGRLRRWKDQKKNRPRCGWCPLLVVLCAQGRATVVEPKSSAGRVGLHRSASVYGYRE